MDRARSFRKNVPGCGYPECVRRKEGGGMRKMTVCALPLAVVSMAGCRTIKGAGRDIEAASDTTREKIHDIVH